MDAPLVVNTALVLSILLGTAVPVASGLLTKAHLNESIRGLVTLTLAAATGFLTIWQFSPDPGHFNWQGAVLNTSLAWVVSIATHFGVFDKVITGPTGLVQRKTGRYGLG